jgi:hypothetical protein
MTPSKASKGMVKEVFKIFEYHGLDLGVDVQSYIPEIEALFDGEDNVVVPVGPEDVLGENALLLVFDVHEIHVDLLALAQTHSQHLIRRALSDLKEVQLLV